MALEEADLAPRCSHNLLILPMHNSIPSGNHVLIKYILPCIPLGQSYGLWGLLVLERFVNVCRWLCREMGSCLLCMLRCHILGCTTHQGMTTLATSTRISWYASFHSFPVSSRLTGTAFIAILPAACNLFLCSRYGNTLCTWDLTAECPCRVSRQMR